MPVDDPVSGIGSVVAQAPPAPAAPAQAAPPPSRPPEPAAKRSNQTQVVAPPSAPRLPEAGPSALPSAAAPPRRRRPIWFLIGVAIFGLVIVPGLAILLFSAGALLGGDPTATPTVAVAVIENTPEPPPSATAPASPAPSATPPPTLTLAPPDTPVPTESGVTIAPSATPPPLPTPERGVNALPNASFEQEPLQNAPFWLISTRRTDLDATWSREQARTGSYALRLTAGEPGQFGPPGWIATVPHTPGHGYGFEVWYRSPDGAVPVVTIEMLDANGRVLGVVTEAARLPSINWQVLRRNVTAAEIDPDTATLRIGLLQFLRAGGGETTLFYDDVALRVDY